MTDTSPLTRRAVLTVGGAGVLGASAFALAGCAPTDTGQASSASTPAASPSAAAGGAATSAPAASGAPAGAAAIAKLADVPVGGATSVTFEGQALLVAQPTAGQVVAFSSVCPHQGCAVAFAKTDFECPCHGSAFELATGDVTKGPAQQGLSKVNVAVSGDSIVAA